ncbi:hypothetical protein PM082_007123 [Marasmius tenuissimus]|nr:hypothetical protein PM082_007123 [Marasmius tenuissimus]
MLHPLVFLLAGIVGIAVASPTPEKWQSITILSTEQVATYKPYTFYASAAYCRPANTITWNCGVNCDANPTFRPVASGGNGGSEQFWYVGYDPTLETVIVGYQGTNTSEIEAVLTDANFALTPLSASLFPNVPGGVLVHTGFRKAHADNAALVLEAVKSTLADNSASSVKVVGHSLGAALAILNTLYLRLQLDPSISVEMIGYGSPRVGNSAFADFAESQIKMTRINNKWAVFSPLILTIVHGKSRRDIVPVLPPRLVGYTHVTGEIHIKEDNTWASCPGRENISPQCTFGTVPIIVVGDAGDHNGAVRHQEMRSQL